MGVLNMAIRSEYTMSDYYDALKAMTPEEEADEATRLGVYISGLHLAGSIIIGRDEPERRNPGLDDEGDLEGRRKLPPSPLLGGAALRRAGVELAAA